VLAARAVRQGRNPGPSGRRSISLLRWDWERAVHRATCASLTRSFVLRRDRLHQSRLPARGAERPAQHHSRCVLVPAEHRPAGAAMDSPRQRFSLLPSAGRAGLVRLHGAGGDLEPGEPSLRLARSRWRNSAGDVARISRFRPHSRAPPPAVMFFTARTSVATKASTLTRATAFMCKKLRGDWRSSRAGQRRADGPWPGRASPATCELSLARTKARSRERSSGGGGSPRVARFCGERGKGLDTPAVLELKNLKTLSSRLFRRDHGKELRRHFRRPVLWSRSCCLVSSGGAPLEVLRAYIENQAGADRARRASPPSKLTLWQGAPCGNWGNLSPASGAIPRNRAGRPGPSRGSPKAGRLSLSGERLKMTRSGRDALAGAFASETRHQELSRNGGSFLAATLDRSVRACARSGVVQPRGLVSPGLGAAPCRLLVEPPSRPG